MELRQLRYFVAVAESLNFTKAAKQLLIAQPSLSQQINALESHLGFKLFERSRQSVELTVAGKSFLNDVREIIKKLDKSVEHASDISKGIVGHLTIGFLNAAAKRFLPKAIRIFNQEYPNINVKLNYYPPDKLIEKLKNDEIDLAFTISAGLHSYENIEYRTLFKPNNYVVVYEDHRLACENEVELMDLIHESFVMVKRETSPESYDQWVSLFLENGFSPMVVEQVESFDTILTLVEAGVGIGFLPKYLESNTDSSAKFIKIKGNSSYFEMVAAWKQNSYKTNPVLPLFLNRLNQFNFSLYE